MVELIWSPRAAADLEEICEYIARDSEYYARFFAQKLITQVETIAEFPGAGRIVPEYQRDDLREQLFQNYRLVYRVRPEAVEVVAIVHGARLLPRVD